MVYIDLFIIILGILWFDLRLLPMHQRLANRLPIIMCMLLAASCAAKLILRDDMFTDIMMLEGQYIFRALASLSFCVFSAVAVSLVLKRKANRHIH